MDFIVLHAVPSLDSGLWTELYVLHVRVEHAVMQRRRHSCNSARMRWCFFLFFLFLFLCLCLCLFRMLYALPMHIFVSLLELDAVGMRRICISLAQSSSTLIFDLISIGLSDPTALFYGYTNMATSGVGQVRYSSRPRSCPSTPYLRRTPSVLVGTPARSVWTGLEFDNLTI